MKKRKIKVPRKLLRGVFHPTRYPRGSLRYRGAYGGRGSAKSQTFAKMASLFGAREPLRILCAREIQASIKQSFHAELKTAINSEPELAARYDVGIDYLRAHNGTEFIFAGLRHNMSSILSMAKIDLCIIEEAESVPDEAMRDLFPTIRAPGSEIWLIWNPRKRESAVNQRFLERTPERSRIVQMNWRDNPWFPPELDELRREDLERLPQEMYDHIWEGAFLERSELLVLGGKYRVARFEPASTWEGPYQGLDFGFVHPTAFVRCWIHGDRLFVEYEAGKSRLDVADTAEFIENRVPNPNRVTTRADSARPETISHLRQNGMPKVRAVKKWPGSVADGINFLRGFEEIVIHERCVETRREAGLYSHKVNKATGEILDDVVDSDNHYIDALRYAVQPRIKTRARPRILRL